MQTGCNNDRKSEKGREGGPGVCVWRVSTVGGIFSVWRKREVRRYTYTNPDNPPCSPTCLELMALWGLQPS
jgi:hypothetical protein